MLCTRITFTFDPQKVGPRDWDIMLKIFLF